MHEALDATTVSPARLTNLQREAADLGVRVARVPPAMLVGETLMRFREARKLTAKKQKLAVQREVVRCGAMYATVMGEILFLEGHFPLAHTWYAVARRAALEAGDQYLADIATGGDTYLAAYAPDPRAVLATVDTRLETKHAASPAIAWLWGFKAKAHAMLGDRGLFELAIHALVRFEQASAFAQAGEIQEACRVAADAVLDQRTYHGAPVITRAKEFDLLLGPSNCEATRDWRELLASLRVVRRSFRAGYSPFYLSIRPSAQSEYPHRRSSRWRHYHCPAGRSGANRAGRYFHWSRARTTDLRSR